MRVILVNVLAILISVTVFVEKSGAQQQSAAAPANFKMASVITTKIGYPFNTHAEPAATPVRRRCNGPSRADLLKAMDGHVIGRHHWWGFSGKKSTKRRGPGQPQTRTNVPDWCQISAVLAKKELRSRFGLEGNYSVVEIIS